MKCGKEEKEGKAEKHERERGKVCEEDGERRGRKESERKFRSRNGEYVGGIEGM